MRPKHYSDLKIQPIDYIRKNKLGFLDGNIIKYISRYHLKNGAEDLQKTKQYLEWFCEEQKPKRSTPVITAERYCSDNKLHPLVTQIISNIEAGQVKSCFVYVDMLLAELEQ